MIDLKKIKEQYATDLKAETEGVWFPLAMFNGVKVKVARAGNPNYKKVLRKLYKPYTKTMRKGVDLAPEVEERIQTDLLVDTLLLDWRGMPGENGEEVPFSKDLARELVTDPELKELREEIIGYSEEFEAFQAREDEELEGN